MANTKGTRRTQAAARRRSQLRSPSRRTHTQRTVAIALVMAMVLSIFAAIIFSSGNDSSQAATTTTAAPTSTTEPPAEWPPFAYGSGECAPADGTPEPVLEFSDAPQLCIDPAHMYTATISTSRGDIVVALDTTLTPGTTNSFINLARSHFYDGSLIHRIASGIDVIQGGDPVGDPIGTGGPGYVIPNEGPTSLTYDEGVIAMANAGPNTGGSQWFLVGGPGGRNLDAQSGWTIFGHVAEGLDVVQDILTLAEGPGHDGPPTEEVVVTSVTITEG